MNKKHYALLGMVSLLLIGFFSFYNYTQTLHAQTTNYSAGTIFRFGIKRTPYYLGSDNKIHAIPNTLIASSWGIRYANVVRLPQSSYTRYEMGGNLTFKPGAVVLRKGTSREYYAVSAPNTLRRLSSHEVAAALFGANWKRSGTRGPLRTLTRSQVNDYQMGAAINSAADYNRQEQLANTLSFVTSALSAPPASDSNSNASTDNNQNQGGSQGAASGGVNVNLSLSSNLDRVAIGTLAKPGQNRTVNDPSFGTSIRRITDQAARGGFAIHNYSQLQSFSADEKCVLINMDEQFRVLCKPQASSEDFNLIDLDLGDTNGVRWHPTQATKLIHFDTNSEEVDSLVRLQMTDIITKRTETLITFPSTYHQYRVNQSWEELSDDGRWMAALLGTANGSNVIVTIDVAARRLVKEIPLRTLYSTRCTPDATYGDVDPDWLGVSPLGRYLAVQWKRDGTAGCSGLEMFNISTGAFVGRTYDGHQHGDMGIKPDGTSEFFMTFELYHPSGRASIGVRDIPGPATVSPVTYVQVYDDYFGGHISCRGPKGVCLITNTSGSGRNMRPLEGEIFLQYIDGRVTRLVHHRSTSCGYWVEPHASISPSGKYVIFGSDWGQETGRNGCGQRELGSGDAYIVINDPVQIERGPANQPVRRTELGGGDTGGGQEQGQQGGQGSGVTPPSAVADIRLGTSLALPSFSLSLTGNSQVTLAQAEDGWDLYMEHSLGTGGCEDGRDFVDYEVYRKGPGATSYTLVGVHNAAAGTNSFIQGTRFQTDGCAKGRFLYDLGLASGTSSVAVCIANTQNKIASQRFCKTVEIRK